MPPGLIYAQTTITSPLLEESTFAKWYDLHTIELGAVPGGPAVCYRYRNVDSSHQKWHFLALYPLKDLGFTSIPGVNSGLSYEHPMLPDGKSIFDLLIFEGRDYALIGDQSTAVEANVQTKWIVTAQVDVGDVDGVAQKVDSVLDERLQGVRCSRYRIQRAPSAVNGLHTLEFHVPRELAIYGADRKEDIDRVVKSLQQKLQGVGVSVVLSIWEAI